MSKLQQKRHKILTRWGIWRLNQNRLFLKKIPNNISKNPKSADFITQHCKLYNSCNSGNSVICQENVK